MPDKKSPTLTTLPWPPVLMLRARLFRWLHGLKQIALLMTFRDVGCWHRSITGTLGTQVSFRSRFPVYIPIRTYLVKCECGKVWQ